MLYDYFLLDVPLAQDLVRTPEPPLSFWRIQRPSRAARFDRAEEVEMRLERSGSVKARSSQEVCRANLSLVSSIGTSTWKSVNSCGRFLHGNNLPIQLVEHIHYPAPRRSISAHKSISQYKFAHGVSLNQRKAEQNRR
jgi:hypothetical protein